MRSGKLLRLLVILLSSLAANASGEELPTKARRAMRMSVDFFRSHVGYQGAYLYRYSTDLSKQEGEHEAFRTTGWTQPPGTPTVGAAYLDAYVLTGEPYLLEAAKESASALIRGQLKSGGWYYKFELSAEHRKRYAYRTEPNNPRGRNYTTLDDNKTQSCVMFLMHLDELLQFRDARLHEAVRYSVDTLAASQYPNGAWPQQFQTAPDPKTHPILHASYPDSWSRKYLKGDYRGHYTFNDNAMSDMIDVMLEAERIYEEPRYGRSARKTGDFMLLAQMPEPQPGWAQQYDQKMHPAWARKFEPAAITGGESQGVMRALLKLAEATGDAKYLKPIPQAVAYYRRSLLPDGRLARFYELKTNRPLYFTKDYRLTYEDDDLPTHYGFKTSSRLDSIERQYRRLTSDPQPTLKRASWRPSKPRPSQRLADEAKAAIKALDSRGAWVESGKLRTYDGNEESIITTATFVKRLQQLSRYVASGD